MHVSRAEIGFSHDAMDISLVILWQTLANYDKK